MIRRTFLAAVAAVAGSAMPALAQDGGLYPAPSAPDASYLRLIEPGLDSAVIDGHDVTVSDKGITPYVEISPGKISLTAGEGSVDVEAGANTHYSYADGHLIKDMVKNSPAQADLLLYNLTDMETFDLYVVEADTAALSDVAPGGHAGVGLKAPLTLTFEIHKDGKTLAALDPVNLRRGTAVTIVMSGGADDLSTTASTSIYNK